MTCTIICYCNIQGFRSSPSSVNITAATAALEGVRQVEAKYPALLFKQQLTAYVEKIYGIIRDNLKKELGLFLSLCIQVRLYRNLYNLHKHCCKSYLRTWYAWILIIEYIHSLAWVLMLLQRSLLCWLLVLVGKLAKLLMCRILSALPSFFLLIR